MTQIYRTPDHSFNNLPDYPFHPNYLDMIIADKSMRLHYLDEGPSNAKHIFLCLHGEPAWSYLYRKMIPVFVEAGHRVIAPDFFGFGKSDKPLDPKAYTFDFHRTTILNLIEKLNLESFTLVCQDWGGLLGLTLPVTIPNKIEALIVMNTMLATGDFELSEGCKQWFAWSATQTNMNIARLMQRASPHLTEAECLAYEAPFPTPKSKVAAHRFPQLVPLKESDDGAALARQARDWWQNKWNGKSFMAIGMQDPVLGSHVMKRLHGWIKNCPAPLEIKDGGHFVQEWGEEIAREALASFDYNI